MHDHPQRWTLIIPAAGKGLRYGANGAAKQFLQVAGRSLLTHTINKALSIAEITTIVIAVSENVLSSTRELLARECASTSEDASGGSQTLDAHILNNTLDPRILLIAGGETRQESVALALNTINEDSADLVFVHDAVRPLASADLYRRVARCAAENGAAIPCLALTDTIKEVANGTVVSTPLRDHYRRAQTPQAFQTDILLRAHAYAIEHQFEGTDDASLVENLGISVFCVSGEETNIKVTTPSDLRLVEWIMSL